MRPDFFAGMRTPRPPDDLKGRVLRAARAAVRQAAAPDRAPWGFRPLDLVWVGALLLLVACNAWLTLASRPAAAVSARSAVPATPAGQVARTQEEPDFLGFGLRLDTDSARRNEPTLTLGRALRVGS
jgi:hypothetical protein